MSSRPIILLGSTGHLGSKVHRMLKDKVSDAPILPPSDATTASFLRQGAIVIDCSDSYLSDVPSLIRDCISQGAVLVEALAGTETMKNSLSAEHILPAGSGSALLGIGIFPGLTNMMVRELADNASPKEITVGVRVAVLSGAGSSMRRLMVDLAYGGSPLETPTNLVFPSGTHKGVSVSLADRFLIEAEYPGAKVSTLLGLKPEFVVGILQLTSKLSTFQFLRWFIVPTVKVGLYLSRGLVLRSAPAAVEISVCVDGRTLFAQTNDGIKTAAQVIVATAVILAARDDLPAGLNFADEVVRLNEIRACAALLFGAEFDLVISPKNDE